MAGWSDDVDAAPPASSAAPMPAPEAQARAPGRARARRGAAAVGVAVSLLLVGVVFVGRAVVVDTVTTTGAAVTGRLATGSAVVATASTTVTAAIDKAEAVADAAGTLARTVAGPRTPAGVTDAYLDFRATYDDARSAAVATLSQFDTLADPPDGRIAQGLRDRLGGVQDAVGALERRIEELPTIAKAVLVARVGGIIEDAARQVASTLTALSAVLDQALMQLDTTRERIASVASEIATATTLVAVLLAAWFVYTALLNVVLFRSRG